jgi:hypothetical protein
LNLLFTTKGTLQSQKPIDIAASRTVTSRTVDMGTLPPPPAKDDPRETRDQTDKRVVQLEQRLEEEKMARNYLQLEKVTGQTLKSVLLPIRKHTFPK